MQNNSNSSSALSYEAYINNMNNQFTFYFVVVSSAIGIPGNLISMFVFIRLAIKNKNINMGILYTCQTIIDLIVLVATLLLLRGPVFLFGYSFLNIHDAYCRVFSFMKRFLLHASIWMSVLIAFDRFIFVLYNNRFKFMKNKRILSAIIAGMLLSIAIIDVENFFFTLSPSKNALLTCLGNNAVTLAGDVISALMRTYIPMTLMAVFNGHVIYRLFKSANSAKVSHKSTTRIRRREHQFTLAAMSCNILYFLTNFPMSVFYILFDVHLYSGTFKSDSTFSAVYSLYMNIFISLAFILQTCSIFMYLAFNNLFRKEFCALFSFNGFFNLNSETSFSQSVSKRNNDQLSLSGKE